MLCLHVLLGDELFDVVDGDGVVNITACTGILAELGTYASADCGEGVFLLDKLQGILISSHRRKLYIALNCYVGRAICLTGSRTGLDYVFTVFSPVLVPMLPAPYLIIGRFGFFYLYRSGRAQLLSEPQSVHLAVFNTLTAGDAFALVNLSAIIGLHNGRIIKEPAASQGKAGALAAVAYAGNSAGAVDVRQLMDKPVVLGSLQYLVCFFLCDLPSVTGFHLKIGGTVEHYAHILFEMAAAFAQNSAGAAAGAVGNGDLPRVFYVGTELICRNGVTVEIYRGFDRDDSHNAHASRQVGGHELHILHRVFIKTARDLGMSFDLLFVADHHLHDTGHPAGQSILLNI